MKKEEAEAAIQFLNRIQLNPQEINAFITVSNALTEIVNHVTAIDKQTCASKPDPHPE